MPKYYAEYMDELERQRRLQEEQRIKEESDRKLAQVAALEERARNAQLQREWANHQKKYNQMANSSAAKAAGDIVANAPSAIDQRVMQNAFPYVKQQQPDLLDTFQQASQIDPNASAADRYMRMRGMSEEPVAQVRPYTSALDQATLIADNLFKTIKYPTQPRQSALQGTNVPDGGIQQPNYASKNPVIPQPSAKETYTPDEELQIADINVKTLPKKEQESLKSIAKKQQEAYQIPLFDASNIDNLDNYNVMLQKAKEEQEMVAERDEFQQRNGLTDQQMSNFLYYQQMLNDKERNDKVRTDIRNSLHEGSGARQAGNALALNALSIMNSPYRGAQAIAGNVAQRALGNRPAGFGIQTNGSPYDYQNFSQAVQEETGNRIAETGAGEVGRFLYNTGVSAAESAYNMALTGMAGTAIGGAVEGAEALKTAQKVLQNASLLPFGANAYASTYQEARERGLDDKSAELTAVVSGAAEIITEKVSLDSLWDMARGNKRFARNAIVNALAQAGIEGSEEVASDLINAVADRIINGDRSEYEQDVQSIMMQNGGDEEDARRQASRNFIKDVGMSFLGGAISGGVMGGVATTVGTASNQAKANQMFNQNTDYAELADSIDTNRDSYENKSAYQSALKAQEKAVELDQKQKSGETITNKDKRNLYTNMMDAVQVEAETRENTTKQEETVENTTKPEENTTKPEETTPNTQLSEEDTTIPAEDTTPETTVPTTETAAPTTEQAVPTTKQEATTTVPVEEKVIDNEQESVTSEQYSPENEQESNITEENNVTSDVPEKYRSQPISQTDMMQKMRDAKTPTELASIYQQSIETGDQEQQRYAEYYKNTFSGRMLDRGISREEIDAAFNAPQTVQAAYEAGLNEQQIDKSVLSSAAQQAYNDGLQQAMIAREKNVETQKGRLAQLMENYSTAASKQAFQRNYIPGMNADTYSYAFDRTYNAGRQVDTFVSDPAQITANIDKAWSNFKRQNGIVFSRVTEQQAQKMFYDGMETASKDMIAATSRSQAEKLLGRKATGLFIDERSNPVDDDSTRFLTGYAMATGINIRVVDSLPDGSNGYYKDGEIVINASKGKNLVTLFHEFGEFTDSMSPEQFQPIVKSGMQVMEEIMGAKEFQAMRKNYEKAYAYEFANNGKTDADLDKEIFCDQLFNIMSHEDGIEKFFQKLDENATSQQAKTFREKLSEILGKIIDSFKNLISGQKLNSYQRQVAEDSLLRMQDLQDRVIEAMANAVNTYQQLETAVHKEMGKDAVLEYDKNGDFQMASSKDADSVLVNLATVGRESRTTLPNTNEKLRKVLEKTGKYEKKDIDAAIDMINRQAQLLEEVALGYREMEEALSADIITDITGRKQVLRSFVKNGEYPVNIDFMTICKKRQAYMRVLTDLIDDGTFQNVSFSPNAIVTVNEILRANGYETACLGCFVESRRLQVQKWSETFVDAWNRQVEKALNGKKATPFNFGRNEKGTSSLTMAEIERMQEEFNAIPKSQKNEKGNIKLGASVPVETKMANLLKKMPSMAHTLEVGDIIKTNGVANLRSNYGELYSLLLQWYGSNTPKVNQDFNPYNGEFADLTYSFMRSEIGESIPWQTKYRTWAKNEIAKEKGEAYKPGTDEVVDRALRKYLFDIGGARLQSFSDFLIENSLDYFQMIGDLAAKEYPMHAYSKEISFARLFGMTGMKLNMSLIPVVNRAAGPDMAGLNPDGSYAGWGDYERHMVIDDKSFIQSIGWKDAIALQLDPRYAKNVGTIAIGISDAHIRKMLNDPLIRMVIPYHKSGMNPDYAKAMNIDFYTDYTDYQNTTVKQYYDLNGNPDSHLVDGYDKKKVKTGIEEFNFNEAAQRLGDAKAAAQEYLDWCAKEHPVKVGGKKIGTCVFTPKFERFTKGEGSENYYKVLEDFNMYDSITGENASQQAVTMTYPGAENALTPAQLAEYEQRLRDTGEFTEEDIKKYLERAQMSMEDIIRKEAADRNAIRRDNDKMYGPTIKKIRDALQEFASTPEERLEKYAEDKEKSKPRNSVDVDTEGTQLTEEQAEYFKDSKIRDENGNLRVMYHGTQNQFTVFDFSQGGKNGTAEGFGIYLTDNPEVSQSYGDRIIKGYANITKPAYSDRRTIKKTELSKLIRETVSQEAKELAEDYDGDLRAAEKDTWISNYVDTYNQSFSSAISEVTESIMRMNDNDMDIIQEVMAGMAIRNYSDAVEFYDVLTRVTGYDGIVTNWTSSEDGSKSLIALAFRSNQIKNVDNLSPTSDPDIRYSKEIADLRRAVNVSDSTDFSDIIGTAADDVAFGQAASILEQGSELLKGQQVDQQLMRRIARKATRKYGSTYDINQFADNIARVFAYAQNYEVSNQEDLTRIMQEVALPVIEQAKSKDIDDVRKDVRRKMAAYKLDLTDNQRKEVMSAFGSYVAYKNAMKKLGVTISANGSDMDQSWGEMASRLPGILDEFVSEGDQPIVLYDTLSNLQKKVVSNGFGMNNEEAATDLALEIMAAYYEEAGRQQGGNAKQAAALKEQMQRTSELAAQYRRDIQKEYDQKYKEKFSRLKQHYSEEQADKLAKITATNSTEAERRLDAYKAREQKDKIKKDLQKLTTMAEHPNKKKHVPAVAMDAVIDLISAIDFVGPNITRNSNGQYEARVLTPGVNGDRSFQTYVADSYMEVMNKYQEALAAGGGSKEQRKWNNSLERVASLYAESAKSYGNGDHIDDFQMTLALKKDLGEALRRVIDKNQGRTSLRSLDSDDLKVIDRVVNNIYTAINNINKSYSMPEEISELGDDLIKHGQEAGYDKDSFKFVKTIKSFLNDNITPETFFHALGGTGDKIYKEVMHAQDMKTAFEREDREFMDSLFKKYGKKNIQKWADDMKTILYEDGTMHLTMGQAMSLLEIVQRPDAQSHLYEGFKAGMIKMKGKEHYDNNAHVLTRQLIKEITEKLTPEQKAFSDELQQYMANVGGKRGNNRTLQMFGYEMFGDPHYFPMNTDKTTIQTNVQNSSEEGAINGILNAGITKEVQENAHNPLILDNILDVFLDHMNQINTYAAYAGVIQDINRINNYKQTDSYEKDGEKHGSRSTVKQALKRLFNENDGERYLVQFLKDVNQKEMSTKTGAGRIAELSKNFKSASTLGNLRVVIQQPTAWFRAGVMIDPQYMAAGLLPNKAADKMQEESSQISWVKSNGNIDGLSINSQRANVLGLQTKVEKINNAMGWLAGKADDVTWNRLYRAVYAEQKAKYKGDLNSEEFRNKVNDRFNELVSRTQVVDGTLMRSQMMRSTDRLNQSFSAFMAEPTKTFNMFARTYIDAAQEYRKTGKISLDTGKMAARIVTVHLLQLAANAFAQSIADAERDEDDDKKFLEKFLEHYGINVDDDATAMEKALTFAEGNFAEGLNVLVQIPVLNQLNDDFVWPIIKQAIWGESTYTTGTTINEFQGITAVYNALKATVFKGDNSKITPYGQLYKVVNALSMLSGIPAAAVMRETVAAYNTINDAWGGENIRKNSPTSAQLVKPVFDSIDSGSDYKAAIEKAVQKGSKYTTIETNITSQYKQKYIDLMREGKTEEASVLENRLMMIYDYLQEQEGQKPSSRKRVQKWYTDWAKENGIEQIELTGGSESSGSRMINMTNVESMDVPVSTEPANIWGNAYVTRQPRGTSYWINGTLDWEREHHTNAARMIQEAFAHGYDPSQPYENDFRRNSEWHMKQINKRNYARKKTYGSGGGNAVAWKSPE